MPEGLASQAEVPAAPQSATPAPAPLGAASTAAMAGPEAQVAPAEQEAYDSAMKMASEIIYVNDASSDKIVEMLGSSKPSEAIRNIVDLVMGKIEEAFNGELPETVVMPVADELTDVIIDLGHESGAFQLDEDQAVQAKGEVVQMLINEYGAPEQGDMQEMAAQGVTEDDVAQYAQIVGGGASG